MGYCKLIKEEGINLSLTWKKILQMFRVARAIKELKEKLNAVTLSRCKAVSIKMGKQPRRFSMHGTLGLGEPTGI